MARSLAEFAIDQTFETAAYAVTEADALAFAREYYPQPFHLDAEAAANSVFRRLVISGWQTAAITMRLIVESGVLRETGIIGTGIDDLRWLAAVAPGDSLRVRGTVVDLQELPGNKNRGIMRVKLLTLNQDDVVVMSEIANLIMPAR